MLRWLMVLVGLLCPVLAWAQDVQIPREAGTAATGPVVPVDLVQPLLDAVRGGRWAFAAGAVLMLLVWVLRSSLLKGLDKKWLPLVGLAVSALPPVADALMAPQVNVGELAASVLTLWLLAAGSWSGVIEPIRGILQRRADQPAPVILPPPPGSTLPKP